MALKPGQESAWKAYSPAKDAMTASRSKHSQLVHATRWDRISFIRSRRPLGLRGQPIIKIGVENVERQRAGIEDQIMEPFDVESCAESLPGSL
jgi:hypothetical protein